LRIRDLDTRAQPRRYRVMRSPFGFPRTSLLTPGRAFLILAGASAGLVGAAALVVLAAVVSASAVVIELETTAAVVIGIVAVRTLQPAVTTIRDSWRARSASELAELRRQLAALPETPHPLGL
jgi:hypothetical protein